MKKKMFFGILILVSILVMTSPIFSQEKVVEFGNKICPVSDEEIKADEAVKYEYNGVIYNFCCKMCLKDFKKDPEKYIKKLEALKEKEKQEEEKAEGDTHEEEHHTHEHHHH